MMRRYIVGSNHGVNHKFVAAFFGAKENRLAAAAAFRDRQSFGQVQSKITPAASPLNLSFGGKNGSSTGKPGICGTG